MLKNQETFGPGLRLAVCLVAFVGWFLRNGGKWLIVVMGRCRGDVSLCKRVMGLEA